MRHEAAGVTSDKFPGHLDVLGQKLKLDYLHEPGSPEDGVTLTVPLVMLNQIPALRCEWLVPGLLEEKALALLKTVPQRHRHRLQPLSQSAKDFVEKVEADEFAKEEGLIRALQRFVEDRISLQLPMESFRSENLNAHFFMNYRVIDEYGRVLDQARDLAELRTRLKRQVSEAFAEAQVPGSLGAQLAALKVASPTAGKPSETAEARAAEPARKGQARVPEASAEPSAQPDRQLTGLTSWSFGELPELLELKVGGRHVIGFPALHDDGDSVSLAAVDTEEEAAQVHRKGLSRLFALTLKDQVKAVEKLPGIRDLSLQFMPFGSDDELKAQLVAATLERTCLLDPLPANAEAFAQRAQEAKTRISLVAQELMRLTSTLLAENASLTKRFATLRAFPAVLDDLEQQTAKLMPKNFLVAYPFERLAHFARYLKAANVRIDKLRSNPERDAKLMSDWKSLAQPFEREWLQKARAGVTDPKLEEFRWMLEELRVSLYAQELKTPMPVSVKRLQKIWDSRPR